VEGTVKKGEDATDLRDAPLEFRDAGIEQALLVIGDLADGEDFGDAGGLEGPGR
jgi:hypothetical protein